MGGTRRHEQHYLRQCPRPTLPSRLLSTVPLKPRRAEANELLDVWVGSIAHYVESMR